MIRKRKIPCTDCDQWREDLELRGFRVLSCEPESGGFCLIKFEEDRPSAKSRSIKLLSQLKGVTGKAEISRSRSIPRCLFEIETSPSKEARRKIADAFLRNAADTLGISQDLSDLKFDKVKESVLGHHVLYQQYMDGTAISGAWMRVDIDAQGRVYNLQNDFVPKKGVNKAAKAALVQGAPKPKSISKAQAEMRAIEVVGKKGNPKVCSSELLYRPSTLDGVPKLAWKIVVQTTRPTAEWRMFLDAETGKVVWKRNVLKSGTGRARVFDPNPVVTLNDTTLTDRAIVPDTAYRIVELKDLKSTGFLDGPYVTTKTTQNRVQKKDRQFMFTRGQKGFKEAMVYFHVDRMQRHLQALGFTNLLSRPIEINVSGQRDDNSFYSPADKSLSFGTGGIDDAEDAEIILHEYGHAIQDDQIPGFGESAESSAMGEGFGDFLAASFFADQKPSAMRSTVGNWDAVAYSTDNPPYLRRIDSNKKYPNDIVSEEHADGEIWSACLWQVRAALGREAAERLVIAHHYLFNRWAGFQDGANALLTADRQLFQGWNATTITDIFVARGVLQQPRKREKRKAARSKH